MLKYVIRRLVFSIFALIGVSILVFLMVHLIPGDPARIALGGRAQEFAIKKLREEMHLDEPLYSQYYFWAKDVLKGNFGRSLTSNRRVLEDIKEYLPASIELTLYAGIIVAILGLFLGVLAGWNSNSPIDNFVRILSYLGVSTPKFVMAIFFILIFNRIFPIFPTLGRIDPYISYPIHITGLVTIDALITGNFKLFTDAFIHIILPSVSLALGSMAVQARIIRSAIVDNLQKDYITAERSYGLPEKLIMFKYLLKPSLIPGITLFAHSVIHIMQGAFLVETIFNWPGLARYSLNAILQKDVCVMQAIVILYGFMFMIANLIVDVIVVNLDPRINLGG